MCVGWGGRYNEFYSLVSGTRKIQFVNFKKLTTYPRILRSRISDFGLHQLVDVIIFRLIWLYRASPCTKSIYVSAEKERARPFATIWDFGTLIARNIVTNSFVSNFPDSSDSVISIFFRFRRFIMCSFRPASVLGKHEISEFHTPMDV